MAIYAIDGVIPVVPATSYVHPEAVLIGDVILGEHCYIGPFASLRGDFGRILLGNGVNVQDSCVLHSFPEAECVLEDDAHIGHASVLHGAHIGRNVLIGMNTVIMDGAHIGENSLVGACSFVKAGFQVPPGHLALGNPAQVVRALAEKEIQWKSNGTRVYHALADRSLRTLVPAEPLRAVETDRPALDLSQSRARPKHQQ